MVTRAEELVLERIAAHGYLNCLESNGTTRYVVSAWPGREGPDTVRILASVACSLIEKELVALAGTRTMVCGWCSQHWAWYRLARPEGRTGIAARGEEPSPKAGWAPD